MEDGVQEVCLVSIFFDRRCPKPVLQSCNPAGFAGPVILFLIGESTPQPGTAEKPVPFHLPVQRCWIAAFEGWFEYQLQNKPNTGVF